MLLQEVDINHPLVIVDQLKGNLQKVVDINHNSLLEISFLSCLLNFFCWLLLDIYFVLNFWNFKVKSQPVVDKERHLVW